jgi:hypothetical protein
MTLGWTSSAGGAACNACSSFALGLGLMAGIAHALPIPGIVRILDAGPDELDVVRLVVSDR